MAVFVTGGTGFVGVNLIRSLVADGEDVRALVRPTSSRLGLESPRITLVTGDITDIDSIRHGMEGCDRVYHLAGWVQITPWGRDVARRVNVDGTENVCKVCEELRVRRLVHTSSVAAVGHGPIDAPATEETAWNLGDLHVPYYDTKHEAELVVHGYVDRGLDAVIVNPGYVVGPYDIKPTGGRMIIRCVTGGIPGYPARGGIGFVDVREVVQGMRAAMDRGRTGERYILNGENLSYGDYSHLIARIAGVAPPRWSVSCGWLYPAAAIASAIGRFRPEWFTDFNLAVVRTGFCEHYVSSGKSRRELRVVLHPIEKAVSDAIDWFEENGYVQRTADGWRALSHRRPAV